MRILQKTFVHFFFLTQPSGHDKKKIVQILRKKEKKRTGWGETEKKNSRVENISGEIQSVL